MELISQISFGLFNGAVWGSVLALLSSGLNVVFGLMGTVNVAHGSFYMIGAFTSLVVLRSGDLLALTGHFPFSGWFTGCIGWRDN